MKPFFSEKDCDVGRVRHVGWMGPGYYEDKPGTSISLEHANALLRGRGKVVHSYQEASVATWYRGDASPTSSHAKFTALLICIEPIETEDTAESLLKEFIEHWGPKDFPGSVCQRARKLLSKGEK